MAAEAADRWAWGAARHYRVVAEYLPGRYLAGLTLMAAATALA